MTEIPEGWFVMGSEQGPQSSRPSHEVFVSAFKIGTTEVTHGHFLEYVRESGRVPLAWRDGVPDQPSNHPVTGILWMEAEAFCRWQGGRLPTEAEWEKAARGTDGRAYPWGNAWDPSRANTSESGVGGVTRVGSFPTGQSPYGVQDMAGNALEWVADYFDPAYFAEGTTQDPKGPEQVLDHGLRGGSWTSPHEQATTYFRDSSHSVLPNGRVGFRCVMGSQ
jgi:formylglycine-generating enzyme required for sulfatase activity